MTFTTRFYPTRNTPIAEPMAASVPSLECAVDDYKDYLEALQAAGKPWHDAYMVFDNGPGLGTTMIHTAGDYILTSTNAADWEAIQKTDALLKLLLTTD